MHDVTFLNCIMSDINNPLQSVASALNLSFNYKLPLTNAVLVPEKAKSSHSMDVGAHFDVCWMLMISLVTMCTSTLLLLTFLGFYKHHNTTPTVITS